MQSIEEFEKEFLRIHKILLPKVEITGRGTVSLSDVLQSASIRLLHHNRALEDSLYEYKGVARFIHYTASPLRVLDIIQSRVIRINSLSYFNDPQEFDFMLRNVSETGVFPSGMDVDIFHRIVDGWKRHIHAWSFCEHPEGEGESFEHWRMYGGDGKGAAIVFEVDLSNKDSWNGFYLGRVHYGENNEAFERLRSFMQCLAEFWASNDLPYYNQLNEFQSVIKSLFAFHKQSIWHLENEVRLVVSTDDTVNGVVKRKYLDRSLNRTSQVELQLDFGKPEEVPIERLQSAPWKYEVDQYMSTLRYNNQPRIRIKEIVLGYGLEAKSVAEFGLAVQDAILGTNHPNIWIRHSELSKYFRK